MSGPFDITNWYWTVAGDTTRAFSSAAGAYVPSSDATLLAWIGRGNQPTKIALEQDLSDMLTVVGLTGPTAASDTAKETLFNNVPRAVKVWALDIDNRVRALEGQPARSANQFKTYVKGLM